MHVCGHSALSLRDTFLSLSLGLNSAPEVFHWKIQHIFVGVSRRVPKSTELMLTSGENLRKRHERELQLTLERAGAAIPHTGNKEKISGREEFGKMYPAATTDEEIQGFPGMTMSKQSCPTSAVQISNLRALLYKKLSRGTKDAGL